MNILVTGATGFVGSVLLPQLLSKMKAKRLSVFILPGERLAPHVPSAGIRVIRGDIRDKAAVIEACRGQSHVIHLAACISYRRRDSGLLTSVNRDGTVHVVEGCLKAGVRRLVHISTEAALGFLRDGSPADESTPFNWPEGFVYAASKLEGQRAVESAVRAHGLPAVILNPASIMGPGDPDPGTPHNRLYRMAHRGMLLGSFSGGLDVVDVRDLTAIILKGLDSGGLGEPYLVAGANISYQDMVRALGRAAGRRAPALKIPAPLVTAAGTVLEAAAALTGARPLLTRAYGRLSGWKLYHSNEKSRKAFGHTYLDLEATVRDGYEYFRSTFAR